MLVCNVILRPSGRVISADLAEVISATDATTTGNVIFATIVDTPAAGGDRVDAYLGQIMVEAAAAAVTVTVGLTYVAAINEATTAISTFGGSVPTVYTDGVSEAAAAAALVDGSVIGISFYDALALDGPIMPAESHSIVIYIEG